MEDTLARQLLHKYINNTLSDTEREQLLVLTTKGSNESLIKLLREMLADENTGPVSVDEARMKMSLAKVLEVDKPLSNKPSVKLVWLRYAAAVLFLAGIGTYAWINGTYPDKPGVTTVSVNTAAYDIPAGGQKALLTLADGSTILLDTAADGKLAAQHGIQILKKDGQIIYTPMAGDKGTPAYNTLRTPRGGTYDLILPDGTKVALNAASSISYPVVFSGKERVVEITGEAYFEVAKLTRSPLHGRSGAEGAPSLREGTTKQSAHVPFIVKINETNSVEVLGTHFNIKAYPDEEVISTTLLEGAVRIASNGKKNILKPGQQAQVSVKQLTVKTIGPTGISEAMAWKEGRFNFQDANLQEIMRQLSRWYDIEIVYEKGIPDLEFIGEIERSLPLSEVLRGLKMSGVNCRLEKGRRLVVLP